MMIDLIKRLYPIQRNLTGPNNLETLETIKEYLPIKITSIPSGTKVFDWIVPKEWHIKDAYIKDDSGKTIVSYKDNPLHVMAYSRKVDKTINLEELRKNIHFIEEYPEWIPYLTTYYENNWGFCMTYNQYKHMKKGKYHVFIDAELVNGHLYYGEFKLDGTNKDSILFSTYICHPSLYNDNLSGIAVQTEIARSMIPMNLKKSYSFIFVPETIGALCWLQNNINLSQSKTTDCFLGLEITCVGHGNIFTYKRPPEKYGYYDLLMEQTLKESGARFKCVDYFPWGSDERQFNSIGIGLQTMSLMRSAYLEYPEYHTSADNIEMMDAKILRSSADMYLRFIYMLEKDKRYISNKTMGEPFLKKYGLYNKIGGVRNVDEIQKAILWILHKSNGHYLLSEISTISGLSFDVTKKAADLLEKTGLIKEIT